MPSGFVQLSPSRGFVYTAIVPPAHPAATILVVEDDSALRDLYQKVLALEGYAVIAAEDGLEALRCVETERVDAVILDLVMPRLDGRGVKRGFDANPSMRNVPVILVTGQVAPDIDRADFACVLHKPISVEELLVAIRNCLDKEAIP
jgi:CheY-like chemotaxis protein